MTKPQAILFERIGGVAEYVFPTGQRGNGIPTHFKIDLAFPELKLAIEVDGNSHGVLSRKLQDKKKEEFLGSKLWHVLRFRNELILSDIDSVVLTVENKKAEIVSANA